MRDIESSLRGRRVAEIGLLIAATTLLLPAVYGASSEAEVTRQTRPSEAEVLFGKERQDGVRRLELQGSIPSFGPPEKHQYAPVIPLDNPKIDVCTTEIGKPLCPRLFFLGAQKAGSSSLWIWARAHWNFLTFPQKPKTAIGPASAKEVHFFDWGWHGGTDYYYSFYPTRNSTSEVSIDATPDYIRYGMVPARLKQVIGNNDVRFLILTRDPVRRAYSWFLMIMRSIPIRKRFEWTFMAFGNDYEILTTTTADLLAACVEEHEGADVFDGCAQDSLYWLDKQVKVPATGRTAEFLGNATQLFSDGMYGDILLHWYRYFPADRFCIAVFERMTANFPAELSRLEPCVRSVAGQFYAPRDHEPYPGVNHAVSKCVGCLTIDDPAFKKLARILCDKLYVRANALFRRILLEHYKWDPAHLPMWEEQYISDTGTSAEG